MYFFILVIISQILKLYVKIKWKILNVMTIIFQQSTMQFAIPKLCRY